MPEIDPVISEYEHEKRRPREADALQTLRKVASLVKPLMRQRGWKVGVLTEFYPPETNLLGLNWNRGQKICLRLRYPHDERSFIPLEQVADTMLHELCHIVHGPHNEAFHTLWDQLREEHEQLARKGYTGEGFLSTGHKLGGARIPKHEARRRARAAAEKRRTLTAGSGQKLGGAPVARGQDIRQVIADAATRRARVTKGCASGMDRSRRIVEETSRNGFRTKAEENDANEEAIMQAYIDLVQEDEMEKWGDSYVPPSKEHPAGSQGSSDKSASLKPNDGAATASKLATSNSENPPSPAIPTSTKPFPTPIDIIFSPSTPKPLLSSSDTWTCDICTLVNPSTYLVCDACGTEKPSPPPSPQNRPPQPQRSSHSQIHPSTSNRSQPAKISTNTVGKKSVKALVTLDRAAEKKPLGWLCATCGNWMEAEWWTCNGCGGMKETS